MCNAVAAANGGKKCKNFTHNSDGLCRLVKEYEDPALVPEYWVCSMNQVIMIIIIMLCLNHAL